MQAKKNSKYKKGGKRRAGPKIEKETRGENGVTGGGCVISLIASTETGNGAVTHRKWADGKDKLQNGSGNHRPMPMQRRKDHIKRILFIQCLSSLYSDHWSGPFIIWTKNPKWHVPLTKDTMGTHRSHTVVSTNSFSCALMWFVLKTRCNESFQIMESSTRGWCQTGRGCCDDAWTCHVRCLF